MGIIITFIDFKNSRIVCFDQWQTIAFSKASEIASGCTFLGNTEKTAMQSDKPFA